MSDIRLGEISFVDLADSQGAFWRGAADTEATLLCTWLTELLIAEPTIVKTAGLEISPFESSTVINAV